jgi:hypothetical protein
MIEARSNPVLQRQLYWDIVNRQGKSLTAPQAELARLAGVDPSRALDASDLEKIAAVVNQANQVNFRDAFDVRASPTGAPRVRAIALDTHGSFATEQDRAYLRRSLAQLDRPLFNNFVEAVRKQTGWLSFSPDPLRSQADDVLMFLVESNSASQRAAMLHVLDTRFAAVLPHEVPPFARAGTRPLSYPAAAPGSDNDGFKTLSALLGQLERSEVEGFLWEALQQAPFNWFIGSGDASDTSRLIFAFVEDMRARGQIEAVYAQLKSLVGDAHAEKPGAVQQYT